MQKEKGIVSIKVKLLGVIVPVVIVSILVLVLIAYRTSAGLIESYSENLLESSVSNRWRIRRRRLRAGWNRISGRSR